MIASRQFFLSLLPFCAISVAGVTDVSAQYQIPSDQPLVKPTCTDDSAKCQHEKESYRLSLLTSKCKETKKNVASFTYSICRTNGKVVSASEHIEAGDGIVYWFENGKVVGIVYPDGGLATFKNGKLMAMYTDNQGDPNRDYTVKTKFTAAERKNMESTAATGYRSIFKKFGL